MKEMKSKDIFMIPLYKRPLALGGACRKSRTRQKLQKERPRRQLKHVLREHAKTVLLLTHFEDG